jgi:hypothetical protein
MDEHEILLAMAICELLGKDVYPNQVAEAFKHAREKLKTYRESSSDHPSSTRR